MTEAEFRERLDQATNAVAVHGQVWNGRGTATSGLSSEETVIRVQLPPSPGDVHIPWCKPPITDIVHNAIADGQPSLPRAILMETVRCVLHSGVVVALLISFGHAPQDHFHPADSDHCHDHYSGSHPAGHFEDRENGAALEAADHDSTARLKDWLAGDGSAPSKHYAEFFSPSSAVLLLAGERAVALVRVRNHDPPAIRTEPARGPPSSIRL
jgi:hypothetical protein